MGSNPIEAATNNKEIMIYDRFNLEEEIQNVWQTKDDLNAVTERIMEDTVSDSMTSDQITNVLIGLSELHETRMWKLWQIFETMVKERGFVDYEMRKDRLEGRSWKKVDNVTWNKVVNRMRDKEKNTK